SPPVTSTSPSRSSSPPTWRARPAGPSRTCARRWPRRTRGPGSPRPPRAEARPPGPGRRGPPLPPDRHRRIPRGALRSPARAAWPPPTLGRSDPRALGTPLRTRGRGRRYSTRDIARLREIQGLSQEDGINLAGIKRILELQDEVSALEDQLSRVRESLETM